MSESLYLVVTNPRFDGRLSKRPGELDARFAGRRTRKVTLGSPFEAFGL